MNAKNLARIESINSDFENFRLLNFLKIFAEVAVMLLFVFVVYGCICDIFSWDVHGFREVVVKIFGIAIRIAAIYGIILMEKYLLIDVVRRYIIGKKKMKEYWKRMHALRESGSDQILKLNRKVRILVERSSSHKFRMQILLGAAVVLLAYAFMVTLCVLFGYESRVSSDVAFTSHAAGMLGLASGILGGLSYLLYKSTSKKVESFQ